MTGPLAVPDVLTAKKLAVPPDTMAFPAALWLIPLLSAVIVKAPAPTVMLPRISPLLFVTVTGPAPLSVMVTTPCRLFSVLSRTMPAALLSVSVTFPATLSPLPSVIPPAAVVMSKSPVIPPTTEVPLAGTYPPVPPITTVAEAPLALRPPMVGVEV